MVGRNHLQGARAQTVPEIILIDFVTEGRRHHAPRGMHPVLVHIFALIQDEMLDQGLAINPLAERAGPRHRLMGWDRGHMHDIERHACGIGQHNGAVGGFAFHFRRPRIGVPFRPGNTLGEQLLL